MISYSLPLFSLPDSAELLIRTILYHRRAETLTILTPVTADEVYILPGSEQEKQTRSLNYAENVLGTFPWRS